MRREFTSREMAILRFILRDVLGDSIKRKSLTDVYKLKPKELRDLLDRFKPIADRSGANCAD